MHDRILRVTCARVHAAACVLAFVALLGAGSAAEGAASSTPAEASSAPSRVDIFVGGEGRHPVYRIPAITRITAACKMRGTRYSLFINGLKRAGCILNRKMLSNLAVEDPKLFDQLVETAKKSSKAVPAKAKA